MSHAVILVEIAQKYFPIVISHDGENLYHTLRNGDWTYADLVALAIQTPQVAVLGIDLGHTALYGEKAQPTESVHYDSVDDVEETSCADFICVVKENNTFTVLYDYDYGEVYEGLDFPISNRRIEQ